MSATDTIEKIDNLNIDDDVHHHRVFEGKWNDTDVEFVALCGKRRKSHPNPLVLPCCPECNKILARECP